MVRKSWATDKVDWKQEHAWWGWLRIHLPEEGVAARFPDEAACVKRLIEVRWGERICCPRCGEGRPFNLSSRGKWQCRGCPNTYQFSPTSETIFQGKGRTLRTWFLAAEYMIQNTPSFVHDLMPPVDRFVDIARMERKAAGRLRRAIFDDLRRDGGLCFLAGIMLTRLPHWPQPIVPGTQEFKAWLLSKAVASGIPLQT